MICGYVENSLISEDGAFPTITDVTEATTADPIMPSFMSPIISSSANSTAATGVLKAAANTAARALTGTEF